MAKKKTKKKASKRSKDTSWSDEDLAIAKSLYMDFMTTVEIAKETGIPRTTIQYHVGQYWKQERAMLSTELVREWADANRPEMSKITRTSVKIMDRALTHLSKRREPPTMKEAIDAAKVFETMDKIARLDKAEGESEVVEQVNSSELIERLKSADPFFENKEGEDDDKKSIN